MGAWSSYLSVVALGMGRRLVLYFLLLLAPLGCGGSVAVSFSTPISCKTNNTETNGRGESMGW